MPTFRSTPLSLALLFLTLISHATVIRSLSKNDDSLYDRSYAPIEERNAAVWGQGKLMRTRVSFIDGKPEPRSEVVTVAVLSKKNHFDPSNIAIVLPPGTACEAHMIQGNSYGIPRCLEYALAEKSRNQKGKLGSMDEDLPESITHGVAERLRAEFVKRIGPDVVPYMKSQIWSTHRDYVKSRYRLPDGLIFVLLLDVDIDGDGFVNAAILANPPAYDKTRVDRTECHFPKLRVQDDERQIDRESSAFIRGKVKLSELGERFDLEGIPVTEEQVNALAHAVRERDEIAFGTWCYPYN